MGTRDGGEAGKKGEGKGKARVRHLKGPMPGGPNQRQTRAPNPPLTQRMLGVPFSLASLFRLCSRKFGILREAKDRVGEKDYLISAVTCGKSRHCCACLLQLSGQPQGLFGALFMPQYPRPRSILAHIPRPGGPLQRCGGPAGRRNPWCLTQGVHAQRKPEGNQSFPTVAFLDHLSG